MQRALALQGPVTVQMHTDTEAWLTSKASPHARVRVEAKYEHGTYADSSMSSGFVVWFEYDDGARKHWIHGSLEWDLYHLLSDHVHAWMSDAPSLPARDEYPLFTLCKLGDPKFKP